MSNTENESVFAAPRLEKLTPETDQFGHLDYAETVAEVLRKAKPPFTLGLYGPWGVGKTLVIKAACEKVEKEFAYAIYDAWRYDGDTLRRHLFRDLATTLEERGELKRGYDLGEKLKRLDIETIEPKDSGPRVDWKYILFVLGALGLLAAIVGVPLWQFADIHRLEAWLFGIGAGILALLISSLVAPFSRVIKVTQVSEITQRVVDPELFTEMFEELLKNVKKKRLILAIDNLDRCSPQRVTELLETLNTYLEPVGDSKGGTDAVFVVAADDGALKRHIESQEAKRSQGLDDLSRVDVGRYADEYLRKIFTTTIPIKPALSTELKAYVEGQVELLAKNRGVEGKDLTSLIEVLAEGLRRNPRRVSQFVKNLELRLLLLKQRFESKKQMMAADLSTPEHVPFVAKLLVLEEEYPDAYAALARDRRLLEKWHQEQAEHVWGREPEKVETPSSDNANGTEKPARFTFTRLESLPPEETRQFAAFLGITRLVQSKQLSAFLSLKQTKYEVDLPRWADFRDALLSSDRDALHEVTAELELEELEHYAATLLNIASESSAYPDAVRALIETALNNESLWDEARPQLADLIQWVLNDPGRKAGLRGMPPERMLPLAEQLGEGDFNDIVQLYATFDDGEMASRFVDALTLLPAETTERFWMVTADRLRGALATDTMASRPSEIFRLLCWWPSGTSGELAEASVKRFETDEEPRSVEADILTICLGNIWKRTGGAAREEILSAATTRVVLFYNASPPQEVADRVAAVEGLVHLVRAFRETLGDNPGSERNPLIAGFNTAIQQALRGMADASDVAPLLDLIGEVTLLGDEATSGPTIQALMNHFRSQHPAALSAYALDRRSEILQPVLVELDRALVALVNNNDSEALAGLVAIHGAGDNDLIRSTLNSAASAGRFDFLRGALEEHSDELAYYREELASTAMATGMPAGLSFALACADALNEEDRSQLAELLGQHLIAIASSDEAEPLLDEIEASAISDRVSSIVGQLWEAAKGQPSPPLGLVRLVAPRRSRLTTANRGVFVDTVEQWFRQGAARDLVDALDGASLKAAERKRYVEAVIAYQASGAVAASNSSARKASFDLVRELAGTSKSSAARKVLDGAIADLESGSPEDHEVYQLLTADSED